MPIVFSIKGTSSLNLSDTVTTATNVILFIFWVVVKLLPLYWSKLTFVFCLNTLTPIPILFAILTSPVSFFYIGSPLVIVNNWLLEPSSKNSHLIPLYLNIAPLILLIKLFSFSFVKLIFQIFELLNILYQNIIYWFKKINK